MKTGRESNTVHEAGRAFEALFGRPPEIVGRAPGRVNLIGEHTDYNGGFVLPIAVDMSTYALAAMRDDGRVRAASREYPDRGEFAAGDRARSGQWHDAVKGVLALLEERGNPLPGLDLYIAGDVPAEAGLSSSAAFIVSLVTALFALTGCAMTPREVAVAARKVENEFLGVPCGILDQMASAACKKGRALLIDCRNMATKSVRVPRGLSILVGNTGVRRKLAEGKYQERVTECALAVEALRWSGEKVRSLRDATAAMLDAHGAAIPKTALMRARHVVEENARVLECVEALTKNDPPRIGELINASHASLRDLYEVSCAELESMVKALTAQDGVLGARLVGAGFGGCAVALVSGEVSPEMIESASAIYRNESGREGTFYVVRPGPGAEILLSPGT